MDAVTPVGIVFPESTARIGWPEHRNMTPCLVTDSYSRHVEPVRALLGDQMVTAIVLTILVILGLAIVKFFIDAHRIANGPRYCIICGKPFDGPDRDVDVRICMDSHLKELGNGPRYKVTRDHDKGLISEESHDRDNLG